MSELPLLGIATGVSSALCHSLAFLVSRSFVLKGKGDSLQLLLAAHVYMGIGAIPLMVFLWPDAWPEVSAVAGALFGSAFFYVFGQVFMINSMRHTQPSRVSPLMGIKVVLMGVVSAACLREQIVGQQWLALLLCTGGVVSLGFAGGRISLAAARSIFLAALFYVLSDLFISQLVQTFATSGIGLRQSALFAVGLTYACCSVVALLILPFRYGVRTVVSQRDSAIPFAVFWLGAMGFYYSTLGLVGPVYGVVLQSTRGIISIALGVLVARMTHQALEHTISGRVLAQRLFSAVAVVLAVWLYGSA